jgi:arylsulfatase A-like enzyme
MTLEPDRVSTTSQPDATIRSPELDQPRPLRHRIGAADLLLLSACGGLAAGLLEVAARVTCRAIDPSQRIYLVSRHFLWLGPLANLLFFLGLGLFLSVAVRLLPRAAGWLAPRLIGACALLPVLVALGPLIYAEAWMLLSLGVAVQFVPILERRIASLRRKLLWSLPVMLGLVILLGAFVFVGDWFKQAREAGRPMPPAQSPNVLLIVLDTVRADHLSLHGYNRSTTPVLEQFASNGIRFDQARATAPWTLPSHASMFTGHWPHEVGDRWMTPLTSSFPTLAEYLGGRGYATAGFVANVAYCSQETGLARGFTHYEDYVLDKLAPLRTSGLIDNVTGSITELIPTFKLTALLPLQHLIIDWFEIGKRKNARSINHAFLGWLSRRREPDRPFFAFLNYFDAHDPYVLPGGVPRRFVRYPVTMDEATVVYELWPLYDKLSLPKPCIDLARDSYDDCLGYLDEQLGQLFDALKLRGLLEKTLVVVTSDHGEGFGEHGLFGHGYSLYQTEIRVPLVIRPPSGLTPSRVVDETVSLRDLAATIVDVLGLAAGSPFPGASFARSWRNSTENAGSPRGTDLVVSELSFPNPQLPNQGRSAYLPGPLISLARDQFVYIRNERAGSEQLFDRRNDPNESSDLSRNEAMRPIIEDFRARFDRFTKGNLTD